MKKGKPSKLACPICKQSATAEYTPFCGRGCKDRDLLQWLGDGYKLPGPVAMGDEDDPAFSIDEE